MVQQLLRVNLTTGEVSSEEIPRSVLTSYMGGKGLGAYYLYHEMPEGVLPLSPGNRLLFTWGPLSGVAPGCSRLCVTTKSPLTGAFLHSYSGGFFPAHLCHSLPSYAGIVFEGSSKGPVYLEVDSGHASLRDASALKGRSTSEVSECFPDREVAAIGMAGENLVAYATIASDRGNHHAGRGGAGAVMGSKNLKAVVVTRGEPGVLTTTAHLFKEDATRLATSEGTRGYREHGTPRVVDMTDATGTLPTRNWMHGSFPYADQINAEAVHAYSTRRLACFGCPIACGHYLQMPDGAGQGKGPEYETLGMLGANLEIGQLSGVARLGWLCNELGIDTISAGSVLGWAMECSERGLLECGIRFGDSDGAADLLGRISRREGIGDLLAGGTRRASAALGMPVANDPAVHVKGLEPPAYDPRGSYSMALAYATSDRGACHMRAWGIGGDVFGDRDPYSPQRGHVEAVIREQNRRSAVPDSLVSCAFAQYTPERALEWLNALGQRTTARDLDAIGERIWNLTRLFNLREGLSRDDDCLPDRMEVPLGHAGPATAKAVSRTSINEMLDFYYFRRGWDNAGYPLPRTLQRLGIE